MPTDLPITEAERHVMEAVWARGPASSRDIVQAVQADENWHPKTVQTLISRLVAKDMLQREKHGRGYLYTPTVDREEFVRRKSRQFVGTFFRGRITPLVAAFAETGNLNREDLQQLKDFVESLDAEHREDES
jgi:BlaI family penicillinase repressor